MTEMKCGLTVLSKEDFETYAKMLYGENRRDWFFVCPWCENKQSVNSVMKIIETQGFLDSQRYGKITKENISELQPKLDQECISPGCNYVSYGLFGGSLEVDDHRYLMLANLENIIHSNGLEEENHA